MIIRKTILTLIGYSFCFCGMSQQLSSETLARTAFHQPNNLYKQDIFLSLSTHSIDSIPSKSNNLFSSDQKGKTDFLKTQFNNSIGKPLDDLKKILKSENEKFFKKPFVLENAQVGYTGISDSSWRQGRTTYYYGSFEMSSAWSIAGIPALFNLQNQTGVEATDLLQNNFAFRFDKDSYLQQLKKRMGDKLNPSSLINGMGDPVAIIKAQAEKLLRNDLASLSHSYEGLLDKDIESIIGNPSSLFSADMKELRERFLTEQLAQQTRDNEVLFSTLQQKANLGEKVNPADLQNSKTAILRMKALQELLHKVEEHKSRWESSGLFKKIKAFELLKKNKMNQLISDPSFIRKQAKQQLSLKGLQRFFLNVNRLNIGRDAVSLSPMSFQHFLHSGISTEFLNRKGNPFMFLFGRQKDINSVLDYGFTDNLFSNNSQAKAVRIGLGSAGISTSQVSVSSFNQSMNNVNGLPFNTGEFRKILVTTISNQLNIGQNGNIAIDLSRSATAYQESGNTGDSVLKPKTNLSRILSSDNLMANTAISLKYADENLENGLAYQVNFSKVSNGYDNPGNTFLNGGSTEFGAQIKKSLLKKKMQLSVRGNLRGYKYNDESDQRWRNSFFVFDAKWKMRKGQYVSLRYQPNRMIRIEEGKKSTVTSIDRIAVETNVYKKINKSSYRNFISIAYQGNKYVLSATENIANTSLQLNSSQNLTVGKNLLYVNISYINSDNRSQYIYFNSSLNTDIGISYQLFKRIMASSGVVYSAVNAWYKQAGIRQSLSGELSSRFLISVYVDARRSFETIQPLWNEPVRADISIRYIFRK